MTGTTTGDVSTLNDSATPRVDMGNIGGIGSRTVLEKTRRDLIVMRQANGDETAPGYRCSNLVELIQTPPHPSHMIKYFTKEGEVYWRNRRTENIERQTADLQRLLA